VTLDLATIPGEVDVTKLGITNTVFVDPGRCRGGEAGLQSGL